MKFQHMTAVFGKLNGDTLAPGPGLTVITGSNEAGKSTWCAFLRAMLYGLDTRERDKAGALADKNRYQPWSGAPMSGQLELEWQGREITLRRFTNKSGPVQGFEGVYSASGDPVPGLTGQSAGQTLVGAGREVFTRCAFLPQHGVPVTAAPELEQRIAALATAGQEDTSFSAAQRTLKDWRNRRQANRSAGLLPQLRRELEAAQAQLDSAGQARALRDQAREQLARLEEERAELEGELSIHRRLAQKELNRRYAQALEELNQAQGELDALPQPDPEFAGLTPQQALEKARRAMAPAPSPAGGEEQALRRRRKGLVQLTAVLVPLLGFGGLAGVIAGFLTRVIPALALGFAGMFLAVCAALLLVSRMGAVDRALSRLAREQADRPSQDGPSPLDRAQAYLDLLSRRQRLEDAVRHLGQRAADLKAQGGREFDTLEFLCPPDRSPEETRRLLDQNRGETARWQSQLDRAEGALSADPLELEARRDQLQALLEARQEEYDALSLALEGLEAANGLLRERFSPALNQEAAALFSQLTGQTYTALSLSRDFSALAGAEGARPRSALYLSAGTTGQLYLAVRLALCRLTLPEVPLVLDDALADFDDQRAGLALEVLLRESEQRQVLLFSCHRREADWARAHGVPVIEL